MSPRLETDRDDRNEARDEPRRPGQGVRAALLALVVTGLVIGSWWAGHRSSPSTPGSAVPEIHPDAAPVKEPPKDPGGLIVPGQDSVLLNHDAKSKPEELLPPPEAVKQRPAPPLPPPQAATANPPSSSSAADTTPPAASPPAAASPPRAAPQVAVTSPAPVAPLAPASPKVASPSAAAGSYRLQLGALKTEAAAKAEWLKLQRQNADVLGKLSLSVSRVEIGAKGTYYRIQAGPLADAEKATQACAALKSRKIACILVKP